MDGLDEATLRELDDRRRNSIRLAAAGVVVVALGLLFGAWSDELTIADLFHRFRPRSAHRRTWRLMAELAMETIP